MFFNQQVSRTFRVRMGLPGILVCQVSYLEIHDSSNAGVTVKIKRNLSVGKVGGIQGRHADYLCAGAGNKSVQKRAQ